MSRFLLSLVVIVHTSSALAQSAPLPAAEVSDASADTVYQELIAGALEEFERGNWAEARHLFLEAHERRPTARTLRGLGIVAFEVRRYVESVGWLERALASDVVPLTERQRAEVETALERARGFVGRYVLVLTPENAQVQVDGDPLELHADGMLWLDVGDHELVVSAPGHQTLKKPLRVRGGRVESLELSLARLGSAFATGSARAEDDSPSVFGTWWFWTLTAAVVGGGASAAFLLTRDPDVQPLIPGDEGVTVRALTVAR